MKTRIIKLLPMNYYNENLLEYNGIEVFVEVIEEIKEGVFQCIFPNGFTTINPIIAWSHNWGISWKFEKLWREKDD